MAGDRALEIRQLVPMCWRDSTKEGLIRVAGHPRFLEPIWFFHVLPCRRRALLRSPGTRGDPEPRQSPFLLSIRLPAVHFERRCEMVELALVRFLVVPRRAIQCTGEMHNQSVYTLAYLRFVRLSFLVERCHILLGRLPHAVIKHDRHLLSALSRSILW